MLVVCFFCFISFSMEERTKTESRELKNINVRWHDDVRLGVEIERNKER